jgi:hypothetical protein
MEDVDLQYRMRYSCHNDLVAVELERRYTFRAYRSTLPEYAVVEQPYLELKKQRDAVREEIKLIRQKSRTRVETPEQNARVAALNAELKKQDVFLKIAAKKVSGDLGLVAVGKEADEVAKAATKAILDDYAARGLTWGTRALVVQELQAAKNAERDPKIHPWDNSGRIGLQLQGKNLSEEMVASGKHIASEQKRLRAMTKELGKKSKVVESFAERLLKMKQDRYAQKTPENRGLPISGLADDTRLQIVVPPEIAYQAASTRRGDRRRAARTTMKMRIGSTPKNAPIWMECKVTMHRQLPADGIIKWAWIRKKMLGTHEIYHLQLIIEAPSFEQKIAVADRMEAIAVDVGWRVREKNVLRIAYLVDTAGNRKEILLPTSIVEKLKHADSLRGKEDDAFNAIQDRLMEWIGLNKPILPAWFQDTFQFLAQSRSSKNLAWNVREWGRRRFAGDTLIYEEMTAWRRQFLHLYEWETNERAKAMGERKNFFRHVGLDLARSAHNVLLEDFKLAKIVENAQPEEDDDNPQTQRHNRVMSAISEFRQAIASACSAWRSTLWKLPAAYTTQDCHACHQEKDKHSKWDAAPAIVHTCQEKCGKTWDQDYNASMNLLGAWLRSRRTNRAA